jgi:hypothetical protein
MVKPILLYLLILSAAVGIIHLATIAWNRHSLRAIAVSSSPKITGISRDFVYDLSGSEAGGLGDAMKLFDENCDPKNDPSCAPFTSPLPTLGADKFFPKEKGLRIVVDLQGIYDLNELYWYDKSPDSDSAWFYTGDMRHWELAAAARTAGSPGGWGWKTFHLQAQSRYVMLRFNSKKSVLTEIALYGRRKQKIPPEAASGGRLAAPTLQEFAGTNAADFAPAYLLASFHQTRVYQLLQWYDADTVHAYPHNQVVLPEGLRAFADSIHLQGNECWLSIRGLPLCMASKGMNERDKPVTGPGMDTEDPLSYGRHAKTYWALAGLLGRTNTGGMDRFENGNEEDGWWTDNYWTPMDYFAMSSADYDGHEGRLGAERGLQAGNARCRLLMSGLSQLDTNRVRTLQFLCRQLRDDRKFIWEGGVQYHYYSTNSASIAQMPTMGVSPEQDHLRQKLARVRAFHDKWLPGVPLILGENGYDRSQESRQRTPLLPGYREAESQGIMVLRSLMAAFMAGFDGYNQYMLRDAGANPQATGPYATSGLVSGPGRNEPFPAWHYWRSAMQLLGDYRPDSIISESGSAWVYRLRHRLHPDSLAYYLVSPTCKGAVIKNFSLLSGMADNQPFIKIKLTDGFLPGARITGRASHGIISLDVYECPTIVFLRRK